MESISGLHERLKIRALEGEVGVSFHYIWGQKVLDVLSLQLEGAGGWCPFCKADGVGEPGVIYVQLGVGADFLSVHCTVYSRWGGGAW